MTPSLNFAKETFDIFNASVFNSSLPVPKFRLSDARTFRGKLSYTRKTSLLRGKINSDFIIRLSVRFDLPKEEWEDVMIHEMIHLHIAAKGIRDSSSHGPVFRKFMSDINRNFNRNITISSRSSEEQTNMDSRVRAHYICLVRFNDGRLGVAPVAKTKLFELWNNFSSWKEVANVSWIGSIDPWFNKFPRVLKTKAYFSSDDEVKAHLNGAMMLLLSGESIRAVRTPGSPDELLP